MTIWKTFEGWTYEYLDRSIAPADMPGFEDLVQLWQDKRDGRPAPAWSDFDFYDFKGWHGRISVYDISYDPFGYTNRLSGTVIDGVYERTMTGMTGTDLEELRVEHPDSTEFYEMTCREMLISRQNGTLDFKGRENVQIIFVELPLSDDGQKATHTLEAMIEVDET